MEDLGPRQSYDIGMEMLTHSIQALFQLLKRTGSKSNAAQWRYGRGIQRVNAVWLNTAESKNTSPQNHQPTKTWNYDLCRPRRSAKQAPTTALNINNEFRLHTHATALCKTNTPYCMELRPLQDPFIPATGARGPNGPMGPQDQETQAQLRRN